MQGGWSPEPHKSTCWSHAAFSTSPLQQPGKVNTAQVCWASSSSGRAPETHYSLQELISQAAIREPK
ncbi:uncharacterized [Tachysurus ichikawai]